MEKREESWGCLSWWKKENIKLVTSYMISTKGRVFLNFIWFTISHRQCQGGAHSCSPRGGGWCWWWETTLTCVWWRRMGESFLGSGITRDCFLLLSWKLWGRWRGRRIGNINLKSDFFFCKVYVLSCVTSSEPLMVSILSLPQGHGDGHIIASLHAASYLILKTSLWDRCYHPILDKGENCGSGRVN